MGNAMSNCFNRILPPAGKGCDLLVLGLQESTYSIASRSSSSSNLEGVPAAVEEKEVGSGAKKEDEGCVTQLIGQVQDILTTDFYLVLR